MLNAVHCNSASSCTAVGAAVDFEFSATDVFTWNGTKWQKATSPTPAGNNGGLWGLSCVSSGSLCTAVGDYGQGADSPIGGPGSSNPLALRN